MGFSEMVRRAEEMMVRQTRNWRVEEVMIETYQTRIQRVLYVLEQGIASIMKFIVPTSSSGLLSNRTAGSSGEVCNHRCFGRLFDYVCAVVETLVAETLVAESIVENAGLRSERVQVFLFYRASQ